MSSEIANFGIAVVGVVVAIITFAFAKGVNKTFFSYDCSERIHVHVVRDRKEAKLWLDPVEVAFNKGYSAQRQGDEKS